MNGAAYIVSGTGFLAGAVIFKEGFSVRGLNTAERIVGRLSLDPHVVAASWRLVALSEDETVESGAEG